MQLTKLLKVLDCGIKASQNLKASRYECARIKRETMAMRIMVVFTVVIFFPVTRLLFWVRQRDLLNVWFCSLPTDLINNARMLLTLVGCNSGKEMDFCLE